MSVNLESLPTVVFAIVLLCWFLFASIFLFRKKRPSATEQKRDPGSIPGVALQGLSYAIIWTVCRTPFTPITSVKAFEVVLSIVVILVALASVFMVKAAVQTLGKEWSVTARVVKGHKLATEGPYRFVRHPIYSGMLGMLLATGLAFSHWLALPAAIAVFFVGTVIRIRSEERLLREALGSEFESYARNVPAIVPGLY
jgi:protein-S-isoprenylcysteine O-methyltransferase Ste14